MAFVELHARCILCLGRKKGDMLTRTLLIGRQPDIRHKIKGHPDWHAAVELHAMQSKLYPIMLLCQECKAAHNLRKF